MVISCVCVCVMKCCHWFDLKSHYFNLLSHEIYYHFNFILYLILPTYNNLFWVISFFFKNSLSIIPLFQHIMLLLRIILYFWHLIILVYFLLYFMILPSLVIPTYVVVSILSHYLNIFDILFHFEPSHYPDLIFNSLRLVYWILAYKQSLTYYLRNSIWVGKIVS